MSKRSLTILVTGATSGIGRHAAVYLARQGHRVIATGRNAAALAALGEAGVETLPLDVTDARSIAAARDAVDAMTGGRGLDVLVNNAGFGVVAPTELITDEDLRAQYETNVFGLMAVTRAFLPQMRARRSGRIINVSSLGGRFTLPLYGAYNSTKYAVESLSDALRVELYPFGVHVSLIEPGAIRSEFMERSMDGGEKYRRADSPYAPVTDRADEFRRLGERTAVGPACISRAIERAATARRPRARYVAPWHAGLMIALLRALPTRWADAMARLTVGFTRRRFAALPMAAFLVLSALAGAAHADAPWELIKQADGIVVERRKVEGSPLKEFRGSATVDAPIASILAVFNDIDKATEWMDSCNASRLVVDEGDRQKVVYNRTHAPWPVSDRDAVLRNVISFDPDRRQVRIDFVAIDDPRSPPVKSVVRMPFVRGHWYLWPTADGSRTRVEYQVHANPGGALPNWLVNYTSKELPFKTINGLRAQLKRRSYPGFEQLLRARFGEFPFLTEKAAARF